MIEDIIKTDFKQVYDINLTDEMVIAVQNPESAMSLSFDYLHVTRAIEYYQYPQYEFYKLSNITEDNQSAYSLLESLPDIICRRITLSCVVISLGLNVFGNVDNLIIWLNVPNMIFKGYSPLDYANQGLEKYTNVISQLETMIKSCN